MSPIYRKETFSFESCHFVLSYVISTLCKEVYLSKRLGIHMLSSLLSMDYSLHVYFFSFYVFSGNLLHNIWYHSSYIGTSFFKMSHLGIFATTFVYRSFWDSETQKPYRKMTNYMWPTIFQILIPFRFGNIHCWI